MSEKQFVDDFSNKVIESTVDERIKKLEHKILRLEKIVHSCSGTMNDAGMLSFLCNGEHPHIIIDGKRIRHVHYVRKALYCEKCDKLYCQDKYCDHLESFINEIKK